MISKMEQVNKGDIVFWNDPEDLNSGYYTIVNSIKTKHDIIYLDPIYSSHVTHEAFIDELILANNHKVCKFCGSANIEVLISKNVNTNEITNIQDVYTCKSCNARRRPEQLTTMWEYQAIKNNKVYNYSDDNLN